MIEASFKYWIVFISTLHICVNSFCPSRAKVKRGSSQHYHPHQQQHSISSSTQLQQTPSIPTYDELSEQKSDALRSMSGFHDGTWICEAGAISSDVSGGYVKRSPPFKTSISTRLGLSTDNKSEALKLIETMSWEQNRKNDEIASDDTFFGRSCLLGSLADIDSVDGSYSLHDFMKGDTITFDISSSASCALPESISMVDPKRVTSVIENCLVATQTERVRCFMIYGKNSMTLETKGDEDNLNEQRLLRTVISHEKKIVQDNDSLDDIVQDMDNHADKLASVMAGKSDDLGQNIKYPITMMTLSLGPWLGDIIIRDKSYNSLLPTSKEKNKSMGFGSQPKKKNRQKGAYSKGGFGEWVLGVQKLTMTFKYDFDCNVRQVFNYGKSMGVYEEGWPQSSGIVYDDRMSRRIKAEDRSMYIDYDNGAYCGFVFGSVYAKASRFLTYQRQGSALPMLSEFALFQRPEDQDNDASGAPKDICCSRITRLYNDDGTLKQGSTSFFLLKPMDQEEN